jgi:hypothetical protein
VEVANNPVAAKALGLTDDQKKEFAGLLEERTAAVRASRNAGPDAFAAAVKPPNEKLLKALTAEQKKKWNELQGEPFKGEFVLQPGMRPFKPPEKK